MYETMQTAPITGQKFLSGYSPALLAGYSTRQRTLGALGQPVQSWLLEDAMAVGYSASDLNLLLEYGATDNDISDLANGFIDFPSLLQELIQAGGGTPVQSIPAGLQQGESEDDWISLGTDLRAANQRLKTLEAAVRADANVARAIGSDVARLLNQYSDMASDYSYWYGMIFGQPPTGLNIAPAVIVAGVAVAFAAIAYALYTWNQDVTVVERKKAEAQVILTQTQQQTVQQKQQLLNQAASLRSGAVADRARGDLQAALAKEQQAQTLERQAATMQLPGTAPDAGPTDWGAWLQKNALTIGLVGGAVILGSKVIKKI